LITSQGMMACRGVKLTLETGPSAPSPVARATASPTAMTAQNSAAFGASEVITNLPAETDRPGSRMSRML